MADTMFARVKGTASLGDDTNVPMSSEFNNPPMETSFNVTASTRGSITLNQGQGFALTPPWGIGSGWVIIAARIIGEAYLETSGLAWGGATTVTAKNAGYGVASHPGFISITTSDLTAASFMGLADNTTIEYVAGLAVADDGL